MFRYLGPVANFIKPLDMLIVQAEEKGSFNFFDHLLQGQFLPRFLVIITAISVPLPFGRYGGGPDKTESRLHGEATQLGAEDLLVAPDLFKKLKTGQVFLGQGILDNTCPVQIEQYPPGKG